MVEAEPIRRLPVYLVLDCSGSMTGEPMQAVRQAIRMLLEDARHDPQALETVYLSVITFAGRAVQTCPLTPLSLFQEPEPTAGGSSALGAALRLLERCIETEVCQPSADRQGDWKPLIFLMTNSAPTDNWVPAADAFRAKRLGKIVACAAGNRADPEVLQYLVEGREGMVIQLKEIERSRIFRSRSSASRAVTGDAPGVGLPPPPPGVVVI